MEFLDYFGLKDLSELPRPEELRALVAAREPEQLDMMELEVVSQVASDLAASEAAHPDLVSRHEIVPVEPPAVAESAFAVATDLAPSDEPSLSDAAPAAEADEADETEERPDTRPRVSVDGE